VFWRESEPSSSWGASWLAFVKWLVVSPLVPFYDDQAECNVNSVGDEARLVPNIMTRLATLLHS